MWSLNDGLKVFEKFNFEKQPVGVKFLYLKPKGIERLEKYISWCEMLPEAQEKGPFYVDKENTTCAAEIISGDIAPAVFRGGGYSFHGGYNHGAGIRFKNLHIPRMPKGIVNYVVFSPLNKLSFDPDVLVVTCNVEQAEILLRASTFTTGKPWISRTSLYLQCAWLLVYPYLNGELNYTSTGLSYGMRFRKVLPGFMLVSIPFDLLPMIVQNLENMQWELMAYKLEKDEYFKWYKEQVEKAQLQGEVSLDIL